MKETVSQLTICACICGKCHQMSALTYHLIPCRTIRDAGDCRGSQSYKVGIKSDTAEFSMGTTLAVRAIWSILSYLREQQFNNWMSYPNVICMGSDSQIIS
jgi:hypothetical protein